MKQSFLLIVLMLQIACNTNNDNKNMKTSSPNDTLSDYSLAMSNVDEYVKISLEICDCMQPMIDKVKEIKSLKEANGDKIVAQKEAELVDIRSKVDICSSEIKQKYNSILTSEKDKKKLLMTLKQYCPDSYKMVY